MKSLKSNLLFIFFIFFFTLSNYSVKAQTYDEALQSQIKLANFMLNSDYPNENKINVLLEEIDKWEDYFSLEDFRKLVQIVEPILFSEINDLYLKILRQSKISVLNMKSYQILSKTNYEVAAFMETTIEKFDKNDSEENIRIKKTFNAQVYTSLTRLYGYLQDYDRAIEYSNKAIDIVKNNTYNMEIPYEKYQYHQDIFISHQAKLELLMRINNLAETKQIMQVMDAKLNYLIENIPDDRVNSGRILSYGRYLIMKFDLGNFNQLEDQINKILSRAPKDITDNVLSDLRDDLIDIVSMLQGNQIKNDYDYLESLELSKIEHHGELIYKIFQLLSHYKKNTLFDVDSYPHHELKASLNKTLRDYQLKALELCNNAHYIPVEITNNQHDCKFSQIIEDFINRDEASLQTEKNQKFKSEFLKILKERRAVGEKYINTWTKALEGLSSYCPALDEKNNDPFIIECNKDRQRYQEYLDESNKSNAHFIEGYIWLYRVKKLTEDIVLYMHHIDLQIKNEHQFMDINTSRYTLFMIEDLYKDIDQNNFLSYSYKKYTNLVQNLRSDIYSYSIGDSENIINSSKEILKKAIEVYDQQNDFKAVYESLKILKQNDFYKFNQRASKLDDSIFQMNLTRFEKDFDLKYLTLKKSVRRLNAEYNRLLIKEPQNPRLNSIRKTIIGKLELFDKYYYEFVSKDTKLQKPKEIFAFDRYEKLNDDESILYIAFQNEVNVNNAPSMKPIEAGVNLKLYLKDNVFSYFYKIENKKLIELINGVSKNLSQNKDIKPEMIQDLSNIFAGPFAEVEKANLKKIKIVYADNYFVNIPMEILLKNKKQSHPNYIVEYINFSQNKANNNKPSKNYAFYGASQGGKGFDPLPGVKEELSLLEKVFSIKSHFKKSFYLNDQFTLESFLDAFKNNTEYIHVASHYKFDAANLKSGSLLLGNGETVNLELMDEKIPFSNNKLIVLSACETGNLIQNEEDIYSGLAATFQHKGAKQVIATLWKIDDKATSLFMYIFYNLISNNQMESSEALALVKLFFQEGHFNSLPSQYNLGRINQQQVLNQISSFQQPHYWAPFIIYSSN